MSLLLDTHILLWWLTDRGRLTAGGAALIADPANRVYLSVASLWEMAIKAALGRLVLPAGLLALLAADRIVLLPITASHALAVATLPPHHGDPFDRMIVAQAIREGLTLVTRDPWIVAYPVPTLRA